MGTALSKKSVWTLYQIIDDQTLKHYEITQLKCHRLTLSLELIALSHSLNISI